MGTDHPVPSNPGESTADIDDPWKRRVETRQRSLEMWIQTLFGLTLVLLILVVVIIWKVW